jgi:hypothetical protein
LNLAIVLWLFVIYKNICNDPLLNVGNSGSLFVGVLARFIGLCLAFLNLETSKSR